EGRRRRSSGDVVAQLVERASDRELGGDLGAREPGRLRGGRRGRRAAWGHLDDQHASVMGIDGELHVGSARLATFPTQHRDRGTGIEASRMIWYSLSVSVCAGAIVIESPVCRPIGSKFSIEQMTMQLSLRSRTTSISNSFQPITDSSTSSSLVGEASNPRSQI